MEQIGSDGCSVPGILSCFGPFIRFNRQTFRLFTARQMGTVCQDQFLSDRVIPVMASFRIWRLISSEAPFRTMLIDTKP